MLAVMFTCQKSKQQVHIKKDVHQIPP